MLSIIIKTIEKRKLADPMQDITFTDMIAAYAAVLSTVLAVARWNRWRTDQKKERPSFTVRDTYRSGKTVLSLDVEIKNNKAELLVVDEFRFIKPKNLAVGPSNSTTPSINFKVDQEIEEYFLSQIRCAVVKEDRSIWTEDEIIFEVRYHFNAARTKFDKEIIRFKLSTKKNTQSL